MASSLIEIVKESEVGNIARQEAGGMIALKLGSSPLPPLPPTHTQYKESCVLRIDDKGNDDIIYHT